MAITQNRMLAVIAAGNAWRKAFETADQELKMILSFHAQGDTTKDELMSALGVLFYQNTPPLGLVEELSTESRYFAKYAHRNEMARQRASGYRWAEGKAPRATAPDKPERTARQAQKLSPERQLQAPLSKQAQEDILAEIEREERLALNPGLANINDPALALKIEDLF